MNLVTTRYRRFLAPYVMHCPTGTLTLLGVGMASVFAHPFFSILMSNFEKPGGPLAACVAFSLIAIVAFAILLGGTQEEIDFTITRLYFLREEYTPSYRDHYMRRAYRPRYFRTAQPVESQINYFQLEADAESLVDYEMRKCEWSDSNLVLTRRELISELFETGLKKLEPNFPELFSGEQDDKWRVSGWKFKSLHSEVTKKNKEVRHE